ncbi:MAG: serine/threonine-protein kinase [Pseudomonadota bacterium]|nr:serine/threonine-protein kinase [Pseudomonadota bacterium]
MTTTRDEAPDPRVRVDALFDQALDLEGQGRIAFLDRVTDGDAPLRAELNALLALVEGGAQALDPGSIAAGALWQAIATGSAYDGLDGSLASGSAIDAGRVVGAWRLQHELGRGGMGSVYLAARVDGGFEQRGALKLIRAGVDSDDFLLRFAQERQILATFDHPNIARLLDGGRDETGRPYLVMECVEGQPIDRHCDAGSLDVPQRVALFVAVARAVSYAHRHLVVHRDLKPSNIVVTSDGEVKLLDFGIAKVLSSGDAGMEALTRTSARLFTPEYATPEQLQGGSATTAADVYQLGLLLYELLCGQRAQRVLDGSAATLEDVVCRREPVRPSVQAMDSTPATLAARRTTAPALRRELRGDLDTIVLKALRKAPERRYASASELADDLERWRQGKPVRARPESTRYRTGKFLKRHPFGVSAAAVLLVVLVAYAATVTLQARTITRERDRAQAEARKAEQVKALVLRLFQGADPQLSGGAQLTARELLDRGWSGIQAELAGEPDVRVELLDTIGEAYRQLGLYDRADPLFEQALLDARASTGSPLLVARALRSLGRLRGDQGRHDESEPMLRDALDRYRSALGDRHPEVAATLDEVGLVRFRRGDAAGAEDIYRRALEMRRALLGYEHVDVADSLDSLGLTLRQRGEYAAAEPLHSEALALRRRLLPPTHPNLARSMSDLALVRTDLGEYDSAEALYREARTIMAQAYGARHPHVATVANNLARLLQVQRRFDEAVPLLRQALDIRREALGERHETVALTFNDLGLTLGESGDLAGAEVAYGQALAAYAPDHHWRAATIFNLGRLAENRGDFAVAERHYRDALERQRRDYGPDHDRVGTDLNRLGVVLHRQGRLREAEAHMRQALSIFRTRLPDGHPRMASVLMPLGTLLLERGDHEDASRMLQEAWRVRHDGYGADDQRTREAAMLLSRAQAYSASPSRQ